MRQIIDGNSIASFVIDKNHKITHWNRACELLTGLSAEKMIGTDDQWSAFYADKRPVMADLIVDGHPMDDLRIHYRRKGRKSGISNDAYEAVDFFPNLGEGGCWLYFTAAPIRNCDGEVIGAIETLQDITKRKKAENSLKLKSGELKERVKELNCLYEITKLKDDIHLSMDDFLKQVVDLIPAAIQQPSKTGVKIDLKDKIITSTGFAESEHCIGCDIVVSGRKYGSIQVFTAGVSPKSRIRPFLDEEIRMLEVISIEIGKYIMRRNAEENLEATHARLLTEQVTLQKKNLALREILEQIEKEKGQIKRRVQTNINNIILPIVQNLKLRLGVVEREYVEVLHDALTDIASPLITDLERNFGSLTPRELEICNMIEKGMSSKDIALVLNVSSQTVIKQRKNIRKKLGINKKDINLISFLKSLSSCHFN